MLLDRKLEVGVDVFLVLPALLHALLKDPEGSGRTRDGDLVRLLQVVAALSADGMVTLVYAFLYGGGC